MKIFDKLFMMGTMSLGDAFALNGLVHYYGDMTDELHICMPSEFIPTIKTLYQDHPHIKVATIEFSESEEEYIKANSLSRIKKPIVNHYLVDDTYIPVWWDVQNYDFYNVPYSVRYSHFRLPNQIEGSEELYQKLAGDREPYILVHRYSYRYRDGFNINIPDFRRSLGLPERKIIEIQEGVTNNMMHYIKLIQNAEEIHCVASAVFNLVDNMHANLRSNLFFHDIRKNSMMRVNSSWNNYPWRWVNYPKEIRA